MGSAIGWSSARFYDGHRCPVEVRVSPHLTGAPAGPISLTPSPVSGS
jgi:hypothetical protein